MTNSPVPELSAVTAFSEIQPKWSDASSAHFFHGFVAEFCAMSMVWLSATLSSIQPPPSVLMLQATSNGGSPPSPSGSMKYWPSASEGSALNRSLQLRAKHFPVMQTPPLSH